MINRREWMAMTGGALALAGCGGGGFDLGATDGDSFDDLLDRLHATDPVRADNLSNHGPMAIEALVALGAADRAVDFLRGYDERIGPFELDAPLPEAEREAALGDIERRAAWIAAYDAELATGDPIAVLARDWPTLAGGYGSIHGALRTSHAVRSLERADTPSRRRELAHALGYWAADHATLPGTPGAAPETGLGVVAALEAVPLLPDDLRDDSGNIVKSLAGLERFPAFATAIAAVDLDAHPVDQALGELVAAAARILVANGGAENNLRGVSLLHAVTGSSALRPLLGSLSDADQRLGLAHAFQMVAAIYSAHAIAPGAGAVTPVDSSAASIAERAAVDSDEHTIKLAEVCLRELAVGDRPEFFAAAETRFS